jgi:5-methylcytosine-specific restriction endonuclease McrA
MVRISRCGNQVVSKYTVIELWRQFKDLDERGELELLNYLRKDRQISRKVALQAFYLTERWQKLRRKVLKRDEYRCRSCFSVKNLNVDHIRYPEIIGFESIDDLQTLCFLCHAEKTKKYNLLKGVEETSVLKYNNMDVFDMIRGV